MNRIPFSAVWYTPRPLLQVPRCLARVIKIELQTFINIHKHVGIRGVAALEGKCQTVLTVCWLSSECCARSSFAEEVSRVCLQSRNYPQQCPSSKVAKPWACRENVLKHLHQVIFILLFCSWSNKNRNSNYVCFLYMFMCLGVGVYVGGIYVGIVHNCFSSYLLRHG